MNNTYSFVIVFPGVSVVRLHVAVRTINVEIVNILSMSLSCISDSFVDIFVENCIKTNVVVIFCCKNTTNGWVEYVSC